MNKLKFSINSELHCVVYILFLFRISILS